MEYTEEEIEQIKDDSFKSGYYHGMLTLFLVFIFSVIFFGFLVAILN